MTIEYECTGCGKKLKSQEEHAGRKARCPYCQAVVTVPEAPLYEAEEMPRRRERPEEDLSRPYDLVEPDETEEEKRRPCPMCGEMILASAVKCRFCGEIFDRELRKRAGSPKAAKEFNKLMSGLGGLWIFFAVIGAVGVIAVSNERRVELPPAAIFIAIGLVAVGFLFGVCTCMKQVWAVYAGVVYSYLFLLLQAVNFIKTVSQGANDAYAAGSVCGIVFAAVL